MYFVEQVRDPLNFVNDNYLILWRQFLFEATGILTQRQVRNGIEQVVDVHAPQRMANEGTFAGLSRPKQEMRLFL